MALIISKDNNPENVFDHHYALKCPHCATQSNISAIAIPRYEFLERFKPDVVGFVYRCDSCNAPIFLRFHIDNLDVGNLRIILDEEYEEVERATESFEYSYLPEEVRSDFAEALTTYSHGAYNAFAAMCRRTVQSVAADLGAKGKDKVLVQLQDLKEMAEIDDETYDLLKQIIVEGHDGSHPHLPALTGSRAAILLELIKDVLYQLYVRKGKLQQAMKLRAEAIDAKKEP